MMMMLISLIAVAVTTAMNSSVSDLPIEVVAKIVCCLDTESTMKALFVDKRWTILLLAKQRLDEDEANVLINRTHKDTRYYLKTMGLHINHLLSPGTQIDDYTTCFLMNLFPFPRGFNGLIVPHYHRMLDHIRKLSPSVCKMKSVFRSICGAELKKSVDGRDDINEMNVIGLIRERRANDEIPMDEFDPMIESLTAIMKQMDIACVGAQLQQLKTVSFSFFFPFCPYDPSS